VHRDGGRRAAAELIVRGEAGDEAVAVAAVAVAHVGPGAVLHEHGQLRAVGDVAAGGGAGGGRGVDAELVRRDRDGRAFRGHGGRGRGGGRAGLLVGNDRREAHVALGAAGQAHIGPGGRVGKHGELVAALHGADHAGAAGGRFV